VGVALITKCEAQACSWSVLSFRYAFDREFSELQEMDERDKFRERYTGGKRDRFRYLIHDNPTTRDPNLFKDPLRWV
jgi:hypothetical protein